MTKKENFNEPMQVRVENYLNSKYDFRWNEVLKDCFYRPKTEHQGEEPQPYQKVVLGNLWRELARCGFKYSQTNLVPSINSQCVGRVDDILKRQQHQRQHHSTRSCGSERNSQAFQYDGCRTQYLSTSS